MKPSIQAKYGCNLKLERITCILFHVRKLARESLTAAAAKLNREDFTKLQQALKIVDASSALEKAASNQKPTSLEKEKAGAKKLSLEKEKHSSRKLKKENSDVSMDSKGYPKMFQDSVASSSPKKRKDPSHAAPVCIARRRPGKLASLEKGELKLALGYKGKKAEEACCFGKGRRKKETQET